MRVLEEGRRRPVAGARVSAHDQDQAYDDDSDEVETRADGTCELSCPDTRLWPSFHVQKPGFVDLWTRLERKPELTLSRGVTLIGHVLAAGSGAPVPGASLLVERARCRCQETVVSADHSGRYELPCVPRHEPFTTVELQAAGFPCTRRSFELRSEEARLEQDFILQPGLEITGHVLGFTSGSGLSGALVWPARGMESQIERGVVEPWPPPPQGAGDGNTSEK